MQIADLLGPGSGASDSFRNLSSIPYRRDPRHPPRLLEQDLQARGMQASGAEKRQLHPRHAQRESS
jgi:hypothetical protein